MWPFRKRPEDLKDDEPALLQRLFRLSPCLHQAYQLREELTAIFEQDLTKAEATEKIQQWRSAMKFSWPSSATSSINSSL